MASFLAYLLICLLRLVAPIALFVAGCDINIVCELLGHSDIKMTLRYSHLAPEHKQADVDL